MTYHIVTLADLHLFCLPSCMHFQRLDFYRSYIMFCLRFFQPLYPRLNFSYTWRISVPVTRCALHGFHEFWAYVLLEYEGIFYETVTLEFKFLKEISLKITSFVFVISIKITRILLIFLRRVTRLR